MIPLIPSFFFSLKEAEKNHFWFAVRKEWILDTVLKFHKPPANILEIGCGTGYVSSFLAQKGYHVTGCEFYKQAIDMSWSGYDKVRGDATSLPFHAESFDIVCLFDVIEHFNGEAQLLEEAHRVLKKDGIIVITVPARSELWSYVDEISSHKRRYTNEDLTAILAKTSFNTLSSEYMFMLLYLPMKILRRRDGKNADIFKIGKTLNFLSLLYFEFERLTSRFVKLPIGTSIISVAKK